MSGHNPHGRLGQPNSSWNHLQVPAFIPRQPQLAHMSNERPLVRSPLTWHTPTHTEAALYNYMAAATHKTPLDMNPLLPAFVRPTLSPFGSVDLSITSSNRHNATLSPKNSASPILSNLNTELAIPNVTKQPSSSLSSSSSSSSSINMNSTNSKEKQSTASKMNGDVVPIVLPGSGLFVRDAKQINEDVNRTLEQLPPTMAAMEFIKDSNYRSINILNSDENNVPSKEPSKSPSSNLTTLLPLQSLPLNELATALINNNLTHPPPQLPLSIALPEPPQPDNQSSSLVALTAPPPTTTSESNSNNSQTTKDCPASTSNDDSLDSVGGKKRRRRKPNKTTRMSNSDNDETIRSTNNQEPKTTINNHQLDSIPNCETSATTTTITTTAVVAAVVATKELMINENGGKVPKTLEANSIISNLDIPQQSVEPMKSNNIKENGTVHEHSSAKCSEIDNNKEEIKPVSSSSSSSSSNNSSEVIAACVKEIQPVNSEVETSKPCQDTVIALPVIETIENPCRPGKRKADSDECETIDKIAAMIADTNAEDLSGQPCTNVPTVKLTSIENGADVNLKVILDTGSKDKTPTAAAVIPIADKNSSFEEVENKLEEMFAGIEDDRPLVDEVIPSKNDNNSVELNKIETNGTIPIDDTTKSETNAKPESNGKKQLTAKTDESPVKKTKKKVMRKTTNNGKTKKGGKGKKNNSKQCGHKNANQTEKKQKAQKDEANLAAEAAAKYRGPYVQVKLDGSANVINAPITEEIAENKSKIKKAFSSQTNNDRSKIRGLHVSTLSMKYDADTTDKTWMCVFCKMGPHRYGLGDLFGPYIITTTCEDFQLSQIDPKLDVFKSKRTKMDMIQKRALPSTSANGNTKKKRKTNDALAMPMNSDVQSLSPIPPVPQFVDIFIGMTKASEESYEVWLHGDCAVWSSGVHIIGSRIIGLEAAVWSSSRHKCSKCSNYGAMMCCLQRGCEEEVHVPCARNSNWLLSDANFKSYCDKHCAIVDGSHGTSGNNSSSCTTIITANNTAATSNMASTSKTVS